MKCDVGLTLENQKPFTTSTNLQMYVSSYLDQNFQQSGMAEIKVDVVLIRCTAILINFSQTIIRF